MALIAKIDGVERSVRTISGTQRGIRTSFDDLPPKSMLAMLDDNTAHELIANLNGRDRERWGVVFGDYYVEYTQEGVTSYIEWKVMTHEILDGGKV